MTDSNDLVQPPLAASENAHLKNMEEYQTMYQKSKSPIILSSKNVLKAAMGLGVSTGQVLSRKRPYL